MRNGLIFLSIIFLIILPYFSIAQTDKQDDIESNNCKNLFWPQFKNDSLWSFRSKKGLVPMTWNNLKHQATSPLRINKTTSIVLFAALTSSAVIYYYDDEIEEKFRPLKDKNQWIEFASPQLTELGDYYGYSFLLLSGGVSMFTSDHKLLHTTGLASEAALLAGIWSRVGKVLTGRMRPGATYYDEEYNEDHWFGPFSQFNKSIRKDRGIGSFDAFPSGHTAAAFAIATVFAERYSDRKAVPWIAYTFSSIVAITRMIEHEHWASDLIPGALIGFACGRQVAKNYQQVFPQYAKKRYCRQQKLNGVSVIPSFGSKELVIRYVF